MKQKGLKLLLCSLALITIVTGCSFGNNKEDEKEKVESNKNQPNATVIEDKTVDGLNISGLNITYKDGMSTVVASVTNTTQEEIKLTSLMIYLKDSKDNLIVETVGNIGDSIKAGETKSFTIFITMDVRKATKADYEIIK